MALLGLCTPADGACGSAPPSAAANPRSGSPIIADASGSRPPFAEEFMTTACEPMAIQGKPTSMSMTILCKSEPSCPKSQASDRPLAQFGSTPPSQVNTSCPRQVKVHPSHPSQVQVHTSCLSQVHASRPSHVHSSFPSHAHYAALCYFPERSLGSVAALHSSPSCSTEKRGVQRSGLWNGRQEASVKEEIIW